MAFAGLQKVYFVGAATYLFGFMKRIYKQCCFDELIKNMEIAYIAFKIHINHFQI